MSQQSQDQHWMREALDLARHAGEQGEVPVGAVLVKDDACIGRGWNQVISAADPTAHAEICALRDAASAKKNYRLPGSTLYVTLEPCTMCAGAIVHARVQRLGFATREPRAGVICSNDQLLDKSFYNHSLTWTEGPLAQESAELLRAFFKARR